MTDRCEIRRCRAGSTITCLGHGVCDRHWNRFTAEEQPSDALRIALGIAAEAEPATEDRTMEPEKSTKKSKTAKPKKEKTTKEPLVVFAFRLTEADRDLIHKAAGPAGASRFVLAAALAAARHSQGAFDGLVEQAKTNLK